MAKLIEELVVIKLTKMVKDSDQGKRVLNDENKGILVETVPALIEEVLNDSTIIVELAEID